MVINFQSLWGKKEILHNLLLDTNVDIVLGTERHLDPSIKDSEILLPHSETLPPQYMAFLRDHSDGWGGVIIIVKSSLIADEIINQRKQSVSLSRLKHFRNLSFYLLHIDHLKMT